MTEKLFDDLDILEFDDDKMLGFDEFEPNPDPFAIHRNRSEKARRADEAKNWKLTSDPKLWASDPGKYDYPGVDTGRIFEEDLDDIL